MLSLAVSRMMGIGVAEEEAYLVRPSLKEFVQYITDDFEYAAANMAEVQKEQGRYTADFARFFLMHHYLNEGYYTTMSALGRTPTSEYIPLPDYAVEQAANSGHTLEQYFTRDNYDGPKK